MKIDYNGQIDLFSREKIRMMIEFDFDMENMADEIIELRETIEKKDKEIEELNTQLP